MAVGKLDRDVLDRFPITAPQTVGPVTTPVDAEEVRRYLGYPKHAPVNRKVEDLMTEWIPDGAALADARGVYKVFPVEDAGKKFIRLETDQGLVEFAGAIGEFLGPVEAVAVFIATAGPGVEARAKELLAAGEMLPGLILNAVGAERAEAAEVLVIEALTAVAGPAGLSLTLPYAPGYCGMALTEQRKLFATLDGSRVGVKLTADCLMTPLKSVSGLIGLGPTDRITAQGSPCDRCNLHTCAMRR